MNASPIEIADTPDAVAQLAEIANAHAKPKKKPALTYIVTHDAPNRHTRRGYRGILSRHRITDKTPAERIRIILQAEFRG